MKKLALVFSLVAASAFAADVKGTISDSKCGKAHADASEKSMKCVNGCVKGGQKAVLITEDGKILQIADQDKVAAHLGHKVTISGDIKGDTVHVESVKM